MSTTDHTSEYAMQRTSALSFLLERLDAWSVNGLTQVSIYHVGDVEIQVRSDAAFHTMRADLGLDGYAGFVPMQDYYGHVVEGRVDGVNILLASCWSKASVTA
jgi:hypothetical protein